MKTRAARRSRNEGGKTDRKIEGQKNGIPVYLSVPYFSVSRFTRSLRTISTIAVQSGVAATEVITAVHLWIRDG
jgi:hypothetical protein